MKLTIHENGVYRMETSEKPKAKEGYAVLRVRACGACGSDIPRVFAGKSYFYPIVLGHEFAGEVVESLNPALVGMRACVFPILPCGECEFCKREEYPNCVSYNYYGSRCDGGMQDYLLVKEQNLIPLPDSVSFEAGSMMEPMAVCLHAIKKADIKPGQTVTVYGAGTIGLLCGMWAKHFGAEKVYLCDLDQSRLDFAKALGFEISGEEAPDRVLEASGSGAALCGAIERIRPFGKIVLVGNAGRDVNLPVAAYSKLLRKQLELCGSWNSDFKHDVNDWRDSVDAMAKGYMDPTKLITHKIPLSEGTRAWDIIGNRSEFYNKITLVNE